MCKAVRLAAALLCFGFLAPPFAAADEYDPSFTLQLENDWFGNIAGADNDRDYTTGIRLAYLSDSLDVPDWVKKITAVPRVFGSEEDNTVWRWGVSINQNIYTPDNTQTDEPIDDDRQYAGWLYLGLTLQGIHRVGTEPVRMDTFDLSLGVVGPWALGEQLQNNFHNVIGDEENEGWDNQIDNQPAVQFTYERRWRTGTYDMPLGLEVDLVPYLGTGLGNVQVYGAAGTILRLGQDLQKDFGPPSIRPALPGSEAFSDRGFSWYLFGGVEGRAVAYDLFLEGVDPIPLIGEGKAGMSLFWGDIRLSYTHVLRSPEFEERDDRWQQYGAVTLGVSF